MSSYFEKTGNIFVWQFISQRTACKNASKITNFKMSRSLSNKFLKFVNNFLESLEPCSPRMRNKFSKNCQLKFYEIKLKIISSKHRKQIRSFLSINVWIVRTTLDSLVNMQHVVFILHSDSETMHLFVAPP